MSLNWGKLYSQGRVKEIGVLWSDEEREAVFLKHIPADLVRKGILTEEGHEGWKKEQFLKQDQAPALEDMGADQLLWLAQDLKIPATVDASKNDLIRVIEQAQKKNPKKHDKKKKAK